MRGKVKWYSSDKGYGFITPDGSEGGRGHDIFVHVRDLQAAGLPGGVVEGDMLEFEIEERAKGKQAVNLVLIGKTGEEVAG